MNKSNKILSKGIFSRKYFIVDAIFLVLVLIAGFVVFTFYSRETKVVYVDVMYTGENISGDLNLSAAFQWDINKLKKGTPVRSTAGTYLGELINMKVNLNAKGHKTPVAKLKLNTMYDKTAKVFKLGDIPLATGGVQTFSIGDFRFKGIIIYLGEEENDPLLERKYVDIGVAALYQESWLADEISKGFKIDDREGILVARSNKVNVKPSISTENLREAKDIHIDMTVLAECIKNICYFENTIPLKVGENFWIESERFVLYGNNIKIISMGAMRENAN